jgi:hypothetical protein
MQGENLSAYFDAFASTAVLAGVAVRGILDLESFDEFDTLTQRPTFLLEPTTAVGPAPGQQLLVAGSETYTVRQVVQEPPDGVLLRLVLARA